MSFYISSFKETITTATTNHRYFLPTAILTAFGIIAVFWFLALQMGMGFLPAEYAMWQTRRQMIAACQLAPTVILGDSRAAAGFLPAQMTGTVNLALGGGTPVEMYYITKALLKCPVLPRQVVISLSPEMFMKSYFFWERTGLYGVLNFEDLEEIRKTSRSLGDTTIYGPQKFADLDAMLDNVLHAYQFPSFYTTYIVRHFAIGRLKANLAVARETLEANGQHSYGTENGSDEIAEDARVKKFAPSLLSHEYFERMLMLFAARGINVTFSAVPINRATYNAMSPDVTSEFSKFLQAIAREHTNFHINGPVIASLDNCYFGDSTHLNHVGASVFSAIVNQRLMQTVSNAR